MRSATARVNEVKVYVDWGRPSATAETVNGVGYITIARDFDFAEEKPKPVNTARTYGMALNKRRGRP
jgi:hypothetical protein